MIAKLICWWRGHAWIPGVNAENVTCDGSYDVLRTDCRRCGRSRWQRGLFLAGTHETGNGNTLTNSFLWSRYRTAGRKGVINPFAYIYCRLFGHYMWNYPHRCCRCGHRFKAAALAATELREESKP